MQHIPEQNLHILVLELPVGQYWYRFVVDGRWKVSEDDENLEEDCFGEWSHFIKVDDTSVEEAVKCRRKDFFETGVVCKVGGLGEGEIGRDVGSVSDSDGEGGDEQEEEEEEEVRGKLCRLGFVPQPNNFKYSTFNRVDRNHDGLWLDFARRYPTYCFT